MRFLLHWLVTTIALWLALRFVPGLSVAGDQWTGLIVMALLLGLVNAIIRPVVSLLSLPVTILSLGLFTFIINAAMLFLASWLTQQLNPASPFLIEGWIAAIVGAIVVTIVSAVLSVLVDG